MAEEIHLNSSRMERELVDFRDVPDLPAQLEILRRMYLELVTWVEGEDKKFLGGKDRMELAPSPYLAIVTIPPSRLEIEQAIHKVQPEIVFFLSHNPRMDAFDKFLQRLSGLVNFGLSKYSGVLELIRLAAACAQREDVIKAGLSCLEARGLIQVTARTSTSYSLGYGDKQAKGSLEASEEHLRKCLAETKAFRKYYQHAEPDGLV
jgi:hypothetical protein